MSREWAWLRLAENGRPVARLRQARSLWERFRGLMLAPPLPAGEALWIPGCAAVHTAFLRASVDLLFLRGREVVRVCRAVPPWRVVICPGADSVVELAAGEAERSGVAAGKWIEVAPVLASDEPFAWCSPAPTPSPSPDLTGGESKSPGPGSSPPQHWGRGQGWGPATARAPPSRS